MPKYSYKAISNAGRLVRGNAIEIDVQALEAGLVQKGFTLVDAKKRDENAFQLLSFSDRVKPRMLIEMYHRIAQTLELGLPIIDALRENAKIVSSKYLKRVIEEIQILIKNGNTLAESMARFPKIFVQLDLALVRLGEQSGVLPQCLRNLADFLEWKEDIRSTIKRAAIYPSFILLSIVAVLGVWVGYVLPQMETLLKNMGVKLPDVTLLVLDTSRFLGQWWLVILMALFGIAGGLYAYQKTPKGGILFHKYVLHLPLVGGVVSNIAIARLSHNFAAMYRAGMSINQIFEILSDNVLGNRYLEEKLKIAYGDIQRGDSIADAIEKTDGFSDLLIGAIRNGESTGTLDDSFTRLGNFYDTEVKRTVQTLINAMEPLSIVLMGCVFGVIALSILLPLYDVIGKIQ